jgi:hypothetical protein
MLSTRLGRTAPPDHWRQVLYRLPTPETTVETTTVGNGGEHRPFTAGAGEPLCAEVKCSHDDLELWFGQSAPPVCSCEVHRAFPDDYWWGVNSSARRAVLVAAADELITAVDTMAHDTTRGRTVEIISLGSSPTTAMLLLARQLAARAQSSEHCRVVSWCSSGLGRGRERILNKMAADLVSSQATGSATHTSEKLEALFSVKLHEEANVIATDESYAPAAVMYDPSRLDCGESQLEQAVWWKTQTDELRAAVGPHLRMWPRSVRVVAQLVSCPELVAVHRPVGTIRGVDMSGINCLRTGADAESVSVRLWQHAHVLASDIQEVDVGLVDQDQVLTFETTCGDDSTVVHGLSVRAEWDYGEGAGVLRPGAPLGCNRAVDTDGMGACVDLSFFKDAQELASGPAGRIVQVRVRLLAGSFGRKGPICTLLDQ